MKFQISVRCLVQFFVQIFLPILLSLEGNSSLAQTSSNSDLATAQFKNFSQDLPQPLPDDPNQPPPDPGHQQPPSGEPTRYSLGSADLGRFSEKEFTFYPRQGLSRVVLVSVTGARNKIVIKEVRLRYAGDANEYFDYILPGDLQAGSTRTVGLNSPRSLSQITIRASSAYFWKKPGNFRVDVAAYP